MVRSMSPVDSPSSTDVRVLVQIASPMPSTSVSVERVVQIARESSALGTLVSVKAGLFADLNAEDNIGPGFPIKLSDLVWAVEFSGLAGPICNPLGTICYSPRPGTTVVYLDYVTGDYRAAEGLSDLN